MGNYGIKSVYIMKRLSFKLVAKSICFCCLFSPLVLLTSCKYDDDELMERIDNIENRLIELEKQCKQININISSLQTIIKAFENQDYIVSVSEITEDNVHIGYRIEFKKAGTITIYHGKNGADGKDGYTPQIGVEKDKNGIYYWTLDGEWLTDEEGNKIKAIGTDGKDGADGSDGADGTDGSNGSNGITPQIRINNGRWEVSYNNGTTWKDLGSATGSVTPSPITSVEIKDKYVIFTLDGGEEINMPLYADLSISFDEQEIELEAGGAIEVSYELTGTNNLDNIQVSAIGEGVRTSINSVNKKLIVSADQDFNGGKVVVHVTDGNNVAVTELTVKVMIITYIEYTATEQIEPKGSAFEGIEEIQFLKDKSTFDNGKGKWAYKGIVTSIGSNAFHYNDKLTGIIIPSTVTSIDQFAFAQTGITEITIPENITELASSAFESCPSLLKVDIKGSIKEISNNTFQDCASLESIILPESLELIKFNAFLRCEKLQEIAIPDNVVTIEKQAFSGCYSLKKIVIGNSVTTIGENTFKECKDVETIVLGESVESIGDNAFNVKNSWDNDSYKKLNNIICLGKVPAKLGTNVFPVDGWESYHYKIQVPTEVLDTYKKEWNQYSNKIIASS